MEWEILTVLIVITGLIATVTKPVMNLTNTITKLNLYTQIQNVIVIAPKQPKFQ